MTNEQYLLVAKAVNTGRCVMYKDSRIKSVESSKLYFHGITDANRHYDGIAWKEVDWEWIYCLDYPLRYTELKDGVWYQSQDTGNILYICNEWCISFDGKEYSHSVTPIYSKDRFRRVKLSVSWEPIISLDENE